MEDLPAMPMYNQPQFWAARTDISGFREAITPLSTVRPLHKVTKR